MYKNFLHNSLHDYLDLKQEYQVRFVNNFVDKVILLGTLVKYKYQKELLSYMLVSNIQHLTVDRCEMHHFYMKILQTSLN